MGLKLYTNKESRGVVVEWLLVELGIECERIEVEYNTSMKSPEYLKLNPFGKVPVLTDGDVVIYELAAVCAYLADKFPQKNLAPALNDPKRGLYYRWLFFISGPWDALATDQMRGIQIQPEQKMFMSYGDETDAYRALIQGLNEARPYLCGEQFTVADVCVGAMLLWQSKMGQLRTDPAIDQYLATIRQRDSLKQSNSIFAS